MSSLVIAVGAQPVMISVFAFNCAANNASLSGHVVIHDHAILSGFTAIHQFCEVGAYSFVAGGSYVRQDILPYVLVAGFNASVSGLNKVGLKRHGFNDATIRYLSQAYKIIFRQAKTVQQALAELHENDRRKR